jgi:hypothetical protein
VQSAVDRLASIPVFAADDPNPPVPPALWEYARSWRVYHAVGLAIPREVLADVAAVWKRRVELRGVLNCLVLHYPCEALLRPLRRTLAAAHQPADLGAWLRAFPDLAGELGPVYAMRARRFNEPFVAVPNALVWGRHFRGGEEAMRAAANAIKRDDRRQARRREAGLCTTDFLRHDLQDHGRLFAAEVAAMNYQLAGLGAETLEFQGMGHWWQTPPPEFELAPERHGLLLAWAAFASHAFAGAAWSDADEAVYAERLARLEPGIRGGFRTRMPGPGERIAALERIAARAAKL